MKDNIRYVGNTVRQEKTKKNKKISLIVTAVLLSLLAAVVVVSGVVSHFTQDENSPYDISTLFQGKGESKSGFPVSFSTNDILDVKPMGKNMLVLTKKFVTPVNKKGQTGTPHPILFAEPAMYANDSNAIVFDRLSDKYVIFGKNGEGVDRQIDSSKQIFDAIVTDKGEVLLSAKSENSASIIHLIDEKGEDKLIWSCSEEYIVAFDISNDGKTVYCAGLGAYGGDIYTKIYVLEVSSGEVLAEHTVPSAASIKLRYLSGDKFYVLCEDALYLCENKKDGIESKEIKFDSRLMFYSIDDGGNVATVTEDPDDFSHNLLSVYNTKGSLVYSLSVDENITDTAMYDREVLLLYGERVKTVTAGGKEGKTLSFDAKCGGTLKFAGGVYCYSLGGVEKAKAE